jgi:hypothetical protein
MTKEKKPVIKNIYPLFEELESECLNTIKYIEALKVKGLTKSQKDDIIGELSASITHLKIQTSRLDKDMEKIDRF